MTNRSVGYVTLALFTLPLYALAEKAIQRSALPPAVERTVQEQSKGAAVKGFSTEMEGGKRIYEAEMMVGAHTRDINIAADGTVLEVEEEVAMESLPTSVQQALTAKTAGAKITKVESLTKKDKLVAYEAATLKGSKKGEFQVGPQGEKLAHEE